MKRRYSPLVLAGIMIALLGAASVMPFIPTQKAGAVALDYRWQYKFVDKATIYVIGTNSSGAAQQYPFVDPNPNDGFYQFFHNEPGCGSDMIEIPKLDPTSDRNKGQGVSYDPAANCEKLTVNIDTGEYFDIRGVYNNMPAAGGGTNPVPQQANPYANSTFDWVDTQTIAASGAKTGTFVRNGAKYENKDTPCGNYDNISNISADFTTATLTYSTNTNGPCYTSTAQIKLGNVQNQKLAPGTSTPQCEDQGGMAWVICPILEDFVDPTVAYLDNTIQGLLMVNPQQFNNAAFKGAWATIRNIALIVLVPIMIVMVIGTALDSGPFDAYTVKRAMPRMLAAVLFIVLSYSICLYAVEFTNALGTGILGLLTSATGQDQPITLATLFNGVGDTVGLFTTAAAGTILVVGAALAGALTFGIALSFAFVTLLALFIGFLILVLRQVVILGLVLFAPVAILSWIFPGNDKIWNVWKTSFTRLLLMFPLITALIGVGRMFAFIVNVK